MPGHIPSLDRDSLARLRELVRAMRESSASSVPMRPLIELARDVTVDGAGVTIDFQAAEQLGSPMVVLRVPAADAPPPNPRLARLTPREREVAALVADGLSNKLIADKLFISLATVKDHVHRILEKTTLPNRAAVAAAAAHRGATPHP